jgi:cytochrome P450
MAADTTAPTATSVHDLDLPLVPMNDGTRPQEDVYTEVLGIAEDHWLGRTEIGFAVFRYDDVIAVLRDKRWYSLLARLNELRGIDDEQGRSILTVEGDEHTRLRRLVAKAFTPRAADQLRPFMRAVMDEQVDRVVAEGRADAVDDLCKHYPIPIICELLGAPREDLEDFSRWADEILSIFDDDAAERYDQIVAAREELTAYVLDLIAARRGDPRDDLLSSLIAAEEEGDRLSNDELVTMVGAVIMAGTDTTRNQLGCALAMLARRPDQWQRLADDPECAPGAVEELMRFAGAVRGTGRFASEDIVYRDVLFPEGTVMNVALAIANRDAAVFDDPDVLDITKAIAGQPQLTFGSGIHYCLGAALARAELQEALPLLARRLPNMRLDGDVVWKPPTVGIFGPESIPIRFDPGH